MAFVDLKRSFVAGGSGWWALGRVGVDGWLMSVIGTVCVGDAMAVLMSGQVGVGACPFAVRCCVRGIVWGVPSGSVLGVVVR